LGGAGHLRLADAASGRKSCWWRPLLLKSLPISDGAQV
jgi:hypothetical protein